MRNIAPKGLWSEHRRRQSTWKWTPEARAAARERAIAKHAANAMNAPPIRSDPKLGLGHLARGDDVPRTFEQSVARARDPKRRVW
jgi:hypothetical protein